MANEENTSIPIIVKPPTEVKVIALSHYTPISTRLRRSACVLGAFAALSIGINEAFRYAIINPECTLPILIGSAFFVLIITVIEKNTAERNEKVIDNAKKN